MQLLYCNLQRGCGPDSAPGTVGRQSLLHIYRIGLLPLGTPLVVYAWLRSCMHGCAAAHAQIATKQTFAQCRIFLEGALDMSVEIKHCVVGCVPWENVFFASRAVLKQTASLERSRDFPPHCLQITKIHDIFDYLIEEEEKSLNSSSLSPRDRVSVVNGVNAVFEVSYGRQSNNNKTKQCMSAAKSLVVMVCASLAQT